MNDKLKRLCLLVIAPLMLCAGCGGQSEDGHVMQAKITATHAERIEVEILSDKYNTGEMWVILTDSTVITNKSGERLKLSALSVGDKMEIVYNGQVMLSYPAQIVGKKITLL